MIEQITEEIESFRKKMTLIMLILPYILFMTIGVLFKHAFVAIFIGMLISFTVFVFMTMQHSAKVKKQINDFSSEQILIKIEKSHNKMKIILYLVLHALSMFMLSFVAEYDAMSTFVAIFSLVFIGFPLLAINSEMDTKTLNTTLGSSPYKEDEYRFKEYPGEREEINDLWYRDVCLPGNPIFVPPPNNSNG